MEPLTSPGRTVVVLLVEDSPSDAHLAMEALREGDPKYVVHHVVDGVAALEFVRRQGPFHAAPRPDLILLDLNLPKMNGLEVLAEIRRDAALKSLMVIILSTSGDERDVLASYELFANLYITKPADFEQFVGVIQMVKAFCFSTIALPVQHDSGSQPNSIPSV